MPKKGVKKIPEWKKEEVKDIIRLVGKYPIFGLVDMENLPALQLQRMRIKLKDSLELKMTRKRLIKIALQQLKDKPNMDKVIESMRGMPALIFTKENPFKLSKLLSSNKSKAMAKPGQTAPTDIIIPAGPTQFTPGPIISELAQSGIKTKVEEGKLSVISDVVLVKEGAKITQKQADLLSRFGIEPMEVGLNIVLVYENGLIYPRLVLTIDEEEYINNIRTASMESISLSISVGYITQDTVTLMVKKAYIETKSVADTAKIQTEDKPKEEKKTEEPKEEFKEAFRTEKGPTAAEVLEEVSKEQETEKEEKKEDEERKKVEGLAENIIRGK